MKLRCSKCETVFSLTVPGTPSPLATTAPSSARTPGTAPAAGGPAAHHFHEGHLVAGRFRIVRFIAAGGMGEVYEAEDTELSERVALKTIRPEVADDPLSLERFRREIQLSRRVTHPNVCRIFDLFRHQGLDSEIAFLSMELLVGETLADRLDRQGPMSAEDALPIAEQMTAGLAAAHRAGVIHRDLKSNNVMLVSDRDELRVVITDFGIARGAAGSGALSQTLTVGGALGTPAYISPEQVEGGQITPSVDLYALGTLLFEMRTGSLPFKGDNVLSTAVKRVTEAAPSPRIHLPNIEPAWERTIVRCLERKPEDRFASAEDVGASLLGVRHVSPPAESTAPLPVATSPLDVGKAQAADKKTNPWVVVGLVGIILLSAVVGYLRHLDLKEKRGLVGDVVPVNPADVIPRRSIAVFDFENVSDAPEREWLSTALPEMMSTQLGSAADLRVVSRVNVARLQADLALDEQEELDRRALDRVHDVLGADLIIHGTYESDEASSLLRVALTLQDTEDGEVIASWSQEGVVEDLFTLLDSSGRTLRGHLGLVASESDGEGARPSSTEVARLYSEGISRLRQFDAQGAHEFLEAAVRADPTDAMAQSALSSALAALGYQKRAEEAARLAFAHSTELADQERLWVEARYREMTGELDRAIEIFRTLWQSYPDDVEYGLRLARTLAAAGQGEAGLATAAALQQLPPPAPEDPRIDLAAAAAAGSMSDFQEQQRAAAAAATKARAQGAVVLTAEARVVEGDALRNIGKPQEAIAAAQEGMQLYSDAGDAVGVAFALTTMANGLFDQGDLESALRRFEEARATYQEIGDASSEARTLNNIAVVVQSQGDLAKAEETYEAALERCLQVENLFCEASTLNNLGGVDFRRGQLSAAKQNYLRATEVYQKLGDRGGEASALDNYAVVLRQQGDLTRAQAEHSKTLAIRREIGHRSGEISSLVNLGRVHLYQGNLSDARAYYQQALTGSQEIGNKSLTARALFGLGDVQLEEGTLDRAQESHEQALDLRTELGERSAGAESRLALARLSVEAGDPAKSAVLAQGAVAEFQKEQLVDNEALAHSVLARAFAAQGLDADSQLEIETAEVLVQMTESRPVRIAVALAVTELLTDPAQYPSAVDALRASRVGLDEEDYYALQLEAELAMGRIEILSGSARDGEQRLGAVAASAREEGFEWVARKADQARP